MTKLLILAYDFPPYVSVGGLRPYAWLKYLREFGIEPIVVTRQWDNHYGNHLDYIAPSKSKEVIVETTEYGTILRAPFKPSRGNRIMLKHGESKWKLVRKFINGFYEYAQYLFPIGPKSCIYTAANDYLKNNKVDVIIATGDPFVLFYYANKLSKQYQTPWIADYRDPWSFGIGMENFFHRNWNRSIEKKVLKNVELITTVNNTFLNKIKTISNKEIFVIPNGYDPDFVNHLKKYKNKKLTIGFAGSILEWHPIETFLTILSQFVTQNGKESIKLNLYGINNAEKIQLLMDGKFVCLKTVVNITPKLPNEEVQKLIAESDLLLLFNYYAITGTKIYDYIGLKIPILFCFSNDSEANKLRDEYSAMKDYKEMEFDVQEKIIEEKNAGFIVRDSNHLLETLNECLKEFNETGEIKCKINDAEEFSRQYQTGKLAKLIGYIHN